MLLDWIFEKMLSSSQWTSDGASSSDLFKYLSSDIWNDAQFTVEKINISLVGRDAEKIMKKTTESKYIILDFFKETRYFRS